MYDPKYCKNCVWNKTVRDFQSSDLFTWLPVEENVNALNNQKKYKSQTSLNTIQFHF